MFSTSSTTVTATFRGGLLDLSSDRDGVAVLSATGMRPGNVRQGVLTLTNTGTVPATLALGASGAPVDSPVSPSLSTALRLTVESCTAAVLACPGATTLFPVVPAQPSLRDFATAPAISLGALAATQQRFFRFTLTWPAATTDPGLQAATTSVTILWRAEAHQ
jgi:hypothetical protein